MAYQYIIDGYNLIYAWPDIPSGTWQDKRAYLLSFLKTKAPQGRNLVTVVFDSRMGLGDRSQEQDITVVFTAGETADDWISAQVRQSSHPRSLVVVTNDKGLQALVRGTGAKILSASDFLKPSASRKPEKGVSQSHPPADSQDITDELKKKWL
jgi:predicted RNA-binding protein with PIN domain